MDQEENRTSGPEDEEFDNTVKEIDIYTHTTQGLWDTIKRPNL